MRVYTEWHMHNSGICSLDYYYTKQIKQVMSGSSDSCIHVAYYTHVYGYVCTWLRAASALASSLNLEIIMYGIVCGSILDMSDVAVYSLHFAFSTIYIYILLGLVFKIKVAYTCIARIACTMWKAKGHNKIIINEPVEKCAQVKDKENNGTYSVHVHVYTDICAGLLSA